MTPEEFRAQYPTHTHFTNRWDGRADNLVGYSATHVAVLCGGCEYSWPLADPARARANPFALPVVDKMIAFDIHEATFGFEETNMKREFWVNGEFEVTMDNRKPIEPAPPGARTGSTAEFLPDGLESIEEELEWVVRRCVAMCTQACVVFPFDDNKTLVVGCDGEKAMAYQIYRHCGRTTRRFGVCPWVVTFSFEGAGCAEVAAAVAGIHKFSLFNILAEDVPGAPPGGRRMRLGFDGFTVKRASAWVAAADRMVDAMYYSSLSAISR